MFTSKWQRRQCIAGHAGLNSWNVWVLRCAVKTVRRTCELFFRCSCAITAAKPFSTAAGGPPKRPLTGYMRFVKEQQPQVTRQYPGKINCAGYSSPFQSFVVTVISFLNGKQQGSFGFRTHQRFTTVCTLKEFWVRCDWNRRLLSDVVLKHAQLREFQMPKLLKLSERLLSDGGGLRLYRNK